MQASGGYRIQLMLGLTELCRSRPAEAMQRVKNALAAVPGHPECQSYLADFSVLTGAADAATLIDQALKNGPDARMGYSGYSPRTLRAFLWLKAGDRAHAQPLIAAALAANHVASEGGDRSNTLSYENAALLLMGGDRAAALDALETSCNDGMKDAAFLKIDPLLAPLAGEPRFVQLVDRLNREVREMKARVDLSDLDELAKGSWQ